MVDKCGQIKAVSIMRPQDFLVRILNLEGDQESKTV